MKKKAVKPAAAADESLFAGAGKAQTDQADRGKGIGDASLAAKGPPEGGTPCLRLVEYEFKGATWRCGRFDLLAAEFALEVGELAEWQLALAAKEHARGWLIARRLFGIAPVRVDPLGDPDDYRTWERPDLASALGIKAKDLQAEVDALRGWWTALRKKGGETAPEVEVRREYRETLNLEGMPPVLKEFQFTKLNFTDHEEQDWFAGRVEVFRKVLEMGITHGLARDALMTEWRIRRLNETINGMPLGQELRPEWQQAMKLCGGLQADYKKMLDSILEACPSAKQIAGQYAFHGVLTDITAGIQKAMADGDNRLVDGMNTAADIQVLLRTHTHRPEVSYRLGLVAHVNAARAGLWDPHWTTPFTTADLRKLDRAFAAVLGEEARQEGTPLVDLEKTGPEGEYPPIYKLGSVKTNQESKQ